jgi:uncharacterized protein (TIGR02246 family)
MNLNAWIDHPEIEQLFSDWKRAMREKNLDGLLRLIAPDGEFWTNGAPALVGHDAIRETFRQFFERFSLDQEFELLELLVRDDLAVARGVEHNRLVPAGGGEPIEQNQRAISILLRQADGRWVFARGMTNLPPTPPDGPDASA